MTRQLIAKTRIKFGSKTPPGQFGFSATDSGRALQPGELFEADAELAKRLLADGSVVTRAQALEEARAISTRGEPIPDVYRAVAAEAHVPRTPAERLNAAADEARAAGLAVTVEFGPSRVTEADQHRAAQERETSAVEGAKTRRPS